MALGVAESERELESTKGCHDSSDQGTHGWVDLFYFIHSWELFVDGLRTCRAAAGAKETSGGCCRHELNHR